MPISCSQHITRALTILALGTLISACDTRKPLVVAWTSNEPAAEISQLLAAELAGDFFVTTMQFDDAAEITEAVRSGVVDLAIIEEPSKTIADVHVLSALFPSVLHVLVKPSVDQSIDGSQAISDVVKGTNVYAGPPGGAGQVLVQMLIRQQVFPPLDQFTLLDSVFEAEPDIFTVFGGILPQEALQRLASYRLVSLGAVNDYGKGSWAEGVALRSPNIQPFIIPEGLYPSIGSKPTLSLSVQSLLVTHPNLSDGTAYLILQKIEDSMARIRGIYPLAGRMASHHNGSSFNLPLHSGALRFEQREAPSFLERYAELLAFLVTAFLALSSLLIALIRMRKQARKDRIDVYFERLLILRGTLHDNSSSHSGVLNEVIALQRTVTLLVSEERIDADSAFIGFLELSNQVLKESRLS